MNSCWVIACKSTGWKEPLDRHVILGEDSVSPSFSHFTRLYLVKRARHHVWRNLMRRVVLHLGSGVLVLLCGWDEDAGVDLIAHVVNGDDAVVTWTTQSFGFVLFLFRFSFTNSVMPFFDFLFDTTKKKWERIKRKVSKINSTQLSSSVTRLNRGAHFRQLQTTTASDNWCRFIFSFCVCVNLFLLLVPYQIRFVFCSWKCWEWKWA